MVMLMKPLCLIFRYLTSLPSHILKNDHVKKFFSTSSPTQQLQSPSEFVKCDYIQIKTFLLCGNFVTYILTYRSWHPFPL